MDEIRAVLRELGYPEEHIAEVIKMRPRDGNEAVNLIEIVRESASLSGQAPRTFSRGELLPNSRKTGDDLELPQCSPEDIARVRAMIARDRGSIDAIRDHLLKYSIDLYNLIRENRITLAALFGFDPKLIEQAE